MSCNERSLGEFLAAADSLVVLSGAGVSTASGIPDYRDQDGKWKTAQPVQFGDFVKSDTVRRKYWARSFAGWPRMARARPNTAHRMLARLEGAGKVDTVITQNVDGLHQEAGSRRVINLHGGICRVICLDCRSMSPRSQFQQSLSEANPDWRARVEAFGPDGDAELGGTDYGSFRVPDCTACGGVIKPDVVMFGESVPKERVAESMAAVERASALLVVGSSLMVYSGFRFVRRASQRNKPIAVVNRGRTRADDLVALKVDGDCGKVLAGALADSEALRRERA